MSVNHSLGNILSKTYNTMPVLVRKVDPCNSDFKNLIETSSYVDKSLLIQSVLDNGPRGILITAPRRFGKSANLSMLKYFLEIQDKSPKSEKDRATPVTGTSNYDLFTKHELNITKHSDIMCKHFGKYPVIHADFKCDTDISSYEDAVAHCRDVVHKSFKQHEYLTESVMLKHSDRSICEEWCHSENYLNIPKSLVNRGLQVLSEYLYKHFNKKCVVLIDEYDAIITNAMLHVTDAHVFSDITQFTLGTMSAALKSNDDNVDRGFMTGISYIAGIRLTEGLNNIICYKFLKDNKFVKFYGLTQDEVANLFNNPIFDLESNLKDKAYSRYNGYMSTGEDKMYCPWSVLNFLKFKEVQNYWRDSGNRCMFSNAIKDESVREEIESLLQGDFVKILEDECVFRDLLKLGELIGNGRADHYTFNYYFLFLWEQGVLSYVPNTLSSYPYISLGLPNDEIKGEMRSILNVFYYDMINNLDNTRTQQCIHLLDNISLETDKYELAMKELIENLEQLWKIFLGDGCVSVYTSPITLQSILFSLIYNTRNYKLETQQYCGKGKTDVITLEKTNLFSIITVHLKKSSREALEHIIMNKYYDFGEKYINKCLLMGFNISADLKVTITYLIINANTDVIDINNAKDIIV